MLKKTGSALHHYFGWFKMVGIVITFTGVIISIVYEGSELIKRHDHDVIMTNNRNVKLDNLSADVKDLNQSFISLKTSLALKSIQIIHHFDSVRLHDVHFVSSEVDSIKELNKKTVKEILKGISYQEDSLKKNDLTTGLLKSE